MLDRTVKLGETLSTLIRERGYSGNRQPVLDAVNVSAAALSQYARDQTRPSFQKLVALANFLEVSLDYLVFGTPSGIVADPEPVVARYVKEAVTGVQAQARAHSALVGRLGRVIADRIDMTAREVAQETSSGGMVEDHELRRLESHATQADIVTIDLDADVIAMPDGTSAAGQFLEVVAHALGQDCTYRFMVSSQPHTKEASVAGFRAMLGERVGDDHVRRLCHFRRASVPILIGMGLYRLDTAALEVGDPPIFTQFSQSIGADRWFGYLIRPNPESDKDTIMNPRRRHVAQDWFETLWSSGTALT